MADWTRELTVEAAKEAAAKFDGPLSKSDFCQRFGVSDYDIYRLFPEGGWTEIRFGAPINFRGLRHAPINEQGVVYL